MLPPFRATVPAQALDSIDLCISGTHRKQNQRRLEAANRGSQERDMKMWGQGNGTFWKGAMSVLILPIKHEEERGCLRALEKDAGKICKSMNACGSTQDWGLAMNPQVHGY